MLLSYQLVSLTRVGHQLPLDLPPPLLRLGCGPANEGDTREQGTGLLLPVSTASFRPSVQPQPSSHCMYTQQHRTTQPTPPAITAQAWQQAASRPLACLWNLASCPAFWCSPAARRSR